MSDISEYTKKTYILVVIVQTLPAKLAYRSLLKSWRYIDIHICLVSQALLRIWMHFKLMLPPSIQIYTVHLANLALKMLLAPGCFVIVKSIFTFE